MKLEKELKKNSGLGSLNKVLLCLVLFCLVPPAYAEPLINDIPLPPVSFSRVDDSKVLEKIGLDPLGGAWCYDDEANAILITAPARERAKCELRLMYELEKQKVRSQFEIDKLTLRVETLVSQHSAILGIKDKEIERLTEAALKRPNDYTFWWASGGFAVGAAATVAIFLAVSK